MKIVWKSKKHSKSSTFSIISWKSKTIASKSYENLRKIKGINKNHMKMSENQLKCNENDRKSTTINCIQWKSNEN